MFTNVLKAELKRAFCGYSFYLAILVGFLGGFMGIAVANDFKFIVFHNSSAYLDWSWGMEFIAIIAPIIAVLPFGDSLVLDRTSGLLPHLLLRVSSGKYIAAKWLANASAGALAVTLVIILSFIFALTIKPLPLPLEWVEYMQGLIDSGRNIGPLIELFVKAPGLYILFTVGIGLLFGAAYATLALALSVFSRSRYLVLAAPFLVYWVISNFFALINLHGWAPWNALMVFGSPASVISILLPLLLLLLAGTLILIPAAVNGEL
jgi:hypothetical protein